MITYKTSTDKQSKIKNALKRTSKFRNVSRELPDGVRQQRHGTELISKQLAETKSRWSRGLAVNRQEGIDVCPYLLRAYLRIGIRVVTRKYNLSSLFEMKDFFLF